MEEKLTIKVNIAERMYPVKINRNEEEKIRKAAKILNEKINQYKDKKFANKDEQDFLAMISLQLSIKLLDIEEKNTIQPIIQKVKNLEEKLREYMETEERSLTY
ncbi:MAG: cell division protein ZapA [Bacteroidetes bacterium RIFOXYA12_FULL_35_11]|nr:MAG: cell division protein ZapA [Bacteroidetes bacterium GWF2_35_48]OFY74344.1 MAG: cell division protein ZapA [Bacteroidetes bacterium RIFOXYA12_FULL_35_11]OFY94688.1 MAG: cell division protein ZapA [Bacteroidetes bacterium RIFOXYB2_FULL_35_7]OFY98112.1 MAG: cell division protein ZapA [Bacteroidetes bacterium RIFOXYC12_FULL_35_7]HBX51996.1 cell division protein ZapA [Bacteroidales bacterium]